MNDLLVATRNKNKLREIKSLLKDVAINVLSVDGLGFEIPDVIENGKTFKENAQKKAFEIARAAQYLTIADDSGLCINELDGMPGVFSARFAGDKKDDHENRQKVLQLMNNVDKKNRNAQFQCAIALSSPAEIISVVEGSCAGVITFEEIGRNGFGYDSIFFFPPLNKTFAELSPDEKNQVSHRSIALARIKTALLQYLDSAENT